MLPNDYQSIKDAMQADLKRKEKRADQKSHLAIAPLADGFQEIKVIWDQLLLPTGIHHLVRDLYRLHLSDTHRAPSNRSSTVLRRWWGGGGGGEGAGVSNHEKQDLNNQQFTSYHFFLFF